MIVLNAAPIESETEGLTAERVRARGAGAVLVVDDSPFSRRSAGLLIQRGLGRPVIFAANGRDALEVIARESPSAVLTDLRMPEMNGLELVEAVRSRYPQIPVVLMTAYGSENVAMQALKIGAANYVSKSDLVGHLVDTLQQILTIAEGNQKRRKVLECQTYRETEFLIDNNPDLISPLLSIIQEDLVSFRIGDETTRMRISVALQEALANALYHGNLECSSDLRQTDERIFYRLAEERRYQSPYRERRIRIKVSVNAREARFVISDEGPGFDVASLDKPFDPEDLLKIGGRGMLLIRTFMDQATHNESGNQITLVKRA